MVRVSCMTFNHAHYIADAMNGFCMQETNFPFVCTIMDDASTDGEQDVIKNYLEAHFDLENSSIVRNEETDDYFLTFAQHKTNKNCYFVVLFLKYNHYSIKKPKKAYVEQWCETKYFAMCEGDDYWVYKRKLQEQVDYLETHDNCALVHSKVMVYDEITKRILSQTKGRNFSSFGDLLKSNKVVSLTVCIRNNVFSEYLKISSTWLEKKDWRMGDYPCWLWISKHYNCHFMDIIMGVYRLLPESASHSNNALKMLSFIDNNYQIQMFFAGLYDVENGRRSILYNDYIKERIRVCCQCNSYRQAYSEIKNLRFKDRLKYIFFIFLKSIKK